MAIIWSGLLIAGLLFGASPASAELQIGDTLDTTNWQEAEGLMPEAILRRFASGQHIATLIEIPTGGLEWGSRFLELTEANVGKYAIDAKGVMVETATGS